MSISCARSCRLDVANIHLPTPRELPPSSRRSGLTLTFVRQRDVDSRSRRDFSIRRNETLQKADGLEPCTLSLKFVSLSVQIYTFFWPYRLFAGSSLVLTSAPLQHSSIYFPRFVGARFYKVLRKRRF